MKVLVEEIASSTPGKNPLLESPQYAAQLAGSAIFFQVVSRLDEHPVRVILHDRFSGERMKLTIERSGEFKPIERVVMEKVQPVITKVTLPISKVPTMPPAAPKVPILRSPSLTPAAPKIAAPAAKAVPALAVPVSPAASAAFDRTYAKEDESLHQAVKRIAAKLVAPKLTAPKIK